MKELFQKYIIKPFKTGGISGGIMLLYVLAGLLVMFITGAIGSTIIILIAKHFWAALIIAFIVGVWYLGYRQAEIRGEALDKFSNDGEEEESIIGFFKMLVTNIKEDYNDWRNKGKSK